MSKYDDLVKKLKEIFQIDRPELDFGVYRILNARVGEINDYLEKRLKAKVAESLAASGAANVEGLHKELKEKEAQYRADGMDPDIVPKVLELREKLAAFSTGASEHENAVFTHLLTFFSRYYDKGDFISQRRYKGDTYAIPYAGEEVVLHWANKDQYYTKSGENFANYGFKLDDGRTVRFRLITADTAKDNRKDNDKERRFVLIEPLTRTLIDEEGDEYKEELLPVEEVTGVNGQELVLRFAYQAMPKGSKQEPLVNDAVQKVLADPMVKARWLDLSGREPTEKNPQRTLLEKCLTSYTMKNTADYFIHKDLGRFLRGELDFYIKSEVMNLDDVQHAATFADIEKNLRLIQTLRAIALDLITFLAQLEDFQKKLWLKKKFVVASHYCITLDRVPESLYPVIAANQQQWEQWDTLGMLEGNKTDLFHQAEKGSVEYLKEHPYLMADTTLFDAAFKQALLAAVDNLDDSLDGLLIHGDNFQALNLLQERYREQVKCVYIDPPYNTGGDGFVYKDAYQHASWMSLIVDRLRLTRNLMTSSAGGSCNLNDIEDWRMRGMIGTEFGESAYVTTVITKCSTPSSFRTVNVGPVDVTDRIIIFAKNRDMFSFTPQAVEKSVDLQHFSRFVTNFDSPPQGWVFKPIRLQVLHDLGFVCENTQNGMRLARARWGDAARVVVDEASEIFALENAERVFELKTLQKPSPWLRPHIEASRAEGKHITEIERQGREPIILLGGRQFYFLSKGVVEIDGKRRLTEPASTLWVDIDTNNLRHEGDVEFSAGKKPLKLVERILRMSEQASGSVCLDYFAGSGTTGHAVISLNRQDKDKGRRKYILVEQGEYFDTVLKPRIQKVVYSADWKDGNATAPQTGISHAFKVLKIESYEDTLNNLQLRRTTQQQSLLDTLPPSAQEDYLLRYLLDIESRGSLLSVEQFAKPFACKLKVTVDSAGAYAERTIDLVETFNYLIGLRVKHIDIQLDKGFVLVTGWLPTGEKTLVLWRDVEQVDYETLNRLCDKLAINPADSEFEVVYINGDHNIPAVFASTEAEGGITKTLKIRQIEPEFLSRMFDVEGV